MRKNLWIRMAAVMTAGVLGLSGCAGDNGGSQGTETTAGTVNEQSKEDTGGFWRTDRGRGNAGSACSDSAERGAGSGDGGNLVSMDLS